MSLSEIEMEIIMNLSKLRDKAKNMAYVNMWKGAFMSNFDKDPEKLIDKYCPQEDAEIMRSYVKSRGGKYKYIFVVINLREGSDVIGWLKKIDKCLKKKWIVDWIWNVEQRGRCLEEMGKGAHINMLLEVKEGKNIYRCRGEIYNTFKNYVGNERCVVGRYSNNKKNFVNYILGIKKDESKDDMIELDLLWRKKMKFKNVYSMENGKLLLGVPPLGGTESRLRSTGAVGPSSSGTPD